MGATTLTGGGHGRFPFIEIGVGALTAWMGSAPLIACLHLLFATISWVSMVLTLAVQFDPGTFRVETRHAESAG